MDSSKLKHIHAALAMIMDMLDDTDAKSSEHLRNPKEDSTGAIPDDATDASLMTDDKPEAADELSADEGEPQAMDDDDTMDQLATMSAAGHPGAAGAMDIFAKEEPDDEDEEDED